MPIPYTLLRYIFREMGKTFALAAIAMTIVFGLGVGVAQMIKLGEVTPWQLVQLLGLVLPVAAALTLPIAALFSASATYGRLSADNEFVACRSSGINLHVLLVPTLVLSLLSASVTFAFNNYVIPSMARNLGEFVGTDIGTVIEQRLRRPRGITLGGRFRIYADGCFVDEDNPDSVTLQGVAFVEVDGDDWVRYGTAEAVQLTFTKEVSRMLVRGSMVGLSFYDRGARQFFEERSRPIPPNELPSPVAAKIKYLSLGQLLHYRSSPESWVKVQDKLSDLQRAIGQVGVYEVLIDEWKDKQTITLYADQGTRYELQSELLYRDPEGRNLELEKGVRLVIDERGVFHEVTAARTYVEVIRGQTLDDMFLQIDMRDVVHHEQGQEHEAPKYVESGIHVPGGVIEDVRRLSTTELLAPQANDPATDFVARQRSAAIEARAETLRKLDGALHGRLAMSVSVFVLVILGAVLGIVFRRAQLVIAFGISFVPSILVLIAIATGRQMAANEPTHMLGLATMWGSIALVALADLWVMTRVLRR